MSLSKYTLNDNELWQTYRGCINRKISLNDLTHSHRAQLHDFADGIKHKAIIDIGELLSANPDKDFQYFAERHSAFKEAVSVINWLSNITDGPNMAEYKAAYQILIDDYTPMVNEIEKELNKYDTIPAKIKYLESKEIQYLLNVKLNPNIMAASGFVTANYPQKAGLDKWIELKIHQLKSDGDTPAKSKSKPSNKTTYKWQGKPDELPQLFSLMRDKYKLIAPKTDLEQFTAIFTGQAIDNIKPIKWINTNRLLAYFLDHIFTNQNWQSIAGGNGYFINKSDKTITANDLSVAKNDYTAYGKPKGYEKIDLILKDIKKHS